MSRTGVERPNPLRSLPLSPSTGVGLWLGCGNARRRQRKARKAVRAAQKQFEREQKESRQSRREALTRAQKAGLSLREIAEEAGLHHSSVAEIIEGE